MLNTNESCSQTHGSFSEDKTLAVGADKHEPRWPTEKAVPGGPCPRGHGRDAYAYLMELHFLFSTFIKTLTPSKESRT